MLRLNEQVRGDNDACRSGGVVRMIIRLDGEVAVVTGAASGIGRGVALGMAEAGASVALLDRDGEGLRAAAQEIVALGGQVTTHELDVSDHDAVAAAVAEAAAALGDATILVTAAAIGGSVKLEEIEPEAWRRMIDINLHGTFWCLRAVIAGMRRRGHGRIILFGSNLGLKGGADVAHYATTKAAIPGL